MNNKKLILPVNVESKEPNLTPEQQMQRQNLAAFVADCRAKPKRAEVYRAWMLERRQRTAATKLLQRYRKSYGIGELWIDQAQADLLQDPYRFGLCPLPAEGSCNIPDPGRELRRQNAIAIEVQFREQERGLVLSQISAQLATFGAIDTMAAQSLWAIALREMPSEQLRAMMAALPKEGAIAGQCRNGLLALALERHRLPLDLGAK